MKFTLVMATIGRKQEVRAFLDCLALQSYKNFELIIVDQNEENFLSTIIHAYEELFTIRHIRSVKRGLSLARNIGIQRATGDIVSFPDDDCVYAEDVLEQAAAFFQEHPSISAISTAWHDPLTNKPVGRFGKQMQPITMLNIWTQVSSITLFIRKEVFPSIGGFDEALGIGPASYWQGAEDKDLPIRLLKAGLQMMYTPHIAVLHPAPVIDAELDEESKRRFLTKTYDYSAAAAYVMNKHSYPFYMKLGALFVVLGKLVISIVTFDMFTVQLRLSSLKGRLHGYFHQPRAKQKG